MAGTIHTGHRARVKQEFLQNGFNDHTPPHKILEMLLFFCLPQGDTNPLAHELLNHFGSLAAVLDAPVEELVRFKGLTESNAVLLKLILPVARAYRISQQEAGFGFESPDAIGRFLLDRYLGETEERLSIISLNGMAQLLSFDYVASGDLTSVGVSTRQIIELVLKTGATCVIMAHNHPKGVALPSGADIAMTETVSSALKHIGVHLIDHIIIARDDYVSLAQSRQYKQLFE